MDFMAPNYFVVVLAAIAGFMAGGIWYGIWGERWMKAAGLTKADIEGPDGQKRGSPPPFILAGIGNFLMALVLMMIIHHVDPKAGLVCIAWYQFCGLAGLYRHDCQCKQ